MENVVSKQSMEALQALASLNLEVSAERALLIQLQEEETAYLVSRETKVTNQIKDKLAEIITLNEQIAILEEEKLKAELPIDLTQAREQIQKDRIEVDKWKDDVLDREITVSSRENNVKEQETALSNKEVEIASKEEKIAAYLTEIEQDKARTNKILADTIEEKRVFDEFRTEKMTELEQKESMLFAKSNAITEERVALEREKSVVEEDKRWIKDRRAMLERGFEELRKKTNK